MISFFDLWERMDSATPLMDSGEDTKALQVIRAGNSLHKKDDRSFWEEFMELCANSQGMADLLNINSSIVTNWTSKIQELLKQVDNIDQTQGNPDEEKKVMPTGDNGAITMPNNSDPNLGTM